jgi:hypothetical protein
LGDIGRGRALSVELAGIADDPQQLAVVLAANPVAGHCGVFAGGLAQQAVQGLQSLLGDGRLPGAVAAPLGELVEDAPRFGQGVLRCIARSGAHSCGRFPMSVAMVFNVSIMKSSASLWVRLSMQRIAERSCSSIAAHRRNEGLREDERILDQVGNVEYQATAARLAVQDRQTVRQAEHPGGSRAQAHRRDSCRGPGSGWPDRHRCHPWRG